MKVGELHIAIDKLYQTFLGPPLSYFELPIPHLEGQYLRVTYQSINVAMVGEQDQTEDALCGWFYSHLLAKLSREELTDHGVFLIWRTKPSISEFPNARGQICTSIRARLAIPGYDLSDMAYIDGAEVRFL